MYRLVKWKSAGEVFPLESGPFRAVLAHIRPTAEWRAWRDVIIAFNPPCSAVWPGEKTKIVRLTPSGKLRAILTGIYRLDLDPIEDGTRPPDYIAIVPLDLARRSTCLEKEGEAFLAAYDSERNILFAADFVHGMSTEEAARATKLLVKELRAAGVPIPESPLHEEEVMLETFPEAKITLGADPEFELVRNGKVIRASGVFRGGEIDLPPYGKIGVDGAGDPAEIRPTPSEDPEVLVRNAGALILAIPKVARMWPSTMCEMWPTGGHIHIGMPREAADYVPELARAIDAELGDVFEALNSPTRRRSSYGRRGDWRRQNWGFEYRTPPAAIWSHPEAAMEFLRAVKHIVGHLLHSGEWHPERDQTWAAIRARAQQAAEFVKKYQGRLHWGAWEKFVGPIELNLGAEVWVNFTSSAKRDDDLVEDLRMMCVRVGLPNITVYPLRHERGDYASNVPGYGEMVENLDPFTGVNAIALSWRFRNDPAFRRAEMPKLEEAIATIVNGDNGDGNRIIKEAILLDGEWPEVPEPSGDVDADDEDDEGEGFVCARCEERFDSEPFVDPHGDEYCEECYYEIYTACGACNMEITCEEAHYADCEAYCESCYHERFAYCEECSEDHPREDVELVRVRDWDGGTTEMPLCWRCRERRYELVDGVYVYVYRRR